MMMSGDDMMPVLSSALPQMKSSAGPSPGSASLVTEQRRRQHDLHQMAKCVELSVTVRPGSPGCGTFGGSPRARLSSSAKEPGPEMESRLGMACCRS